MRIYIDPERSVGTVPCESGTRPIFILQVGGLSLHEISAVVEMSPDVRTAEMVRKFLVI